ncbi:alpha/beta fold hydrolase [Mycobacterium shigaense]|uniref:alpha/beta fold hydrolase n=1 Tax=Mycobacterium shigaense TaxID=722731 RepID=UPI000D3F89F4|nr:alpha/beta hydrolase [Mycobacterium shigaense]MEA1121822.1 alpha/beta hydrolase [Mycobacterium shigaense]PRI16556.1 alpha/beta hydrolase [Mycobacterium shigaense]
MLLHPFLISQMVWEVVAQQLADTGRYEVFAPTMAGHHGGPRAGTWLLSSAVLADHVERQLDELGWATAHIVGNSLGGWVAFELERRGRARSVTGIAPAGGWTRWSPVKFEVIAKFLSGLPIWLLTCLLGQRILRLPFSRQLGSVPVSARPDGVSERQLSAIVDDVSHCPAYYQLLVKALLLHGLVELEHTAVPSHLVLCGKDRVVPPSRFSRHFTEFLPEGHQLTVLDGVGHIPMFEAPDRVTAVISDFVDECARAARPQRAVDPSAS